MKMFGCQCQTGVGTIKVNLFWFNPTNSHCICSGRPSPRGKKTLGFWNYYVLHANGNPHMFVVVAIEAEMPNLYDDVKLNEREDIPGTFKWALVTSTAATMMCNPVA